MPNLHFGGGTIGEGAFATPENVNQLMNVLQSCHINRIDTTAVYPGTSPGESQRLLGAVKAAESGFSIDTKILVNLGEGHPGQGSLRRTAIRESLAASLEALDIPEVRGIPWVSV